MASLPVGRRRVIILLLLTAVLLLTVDLRGNVVLDRARSGFQVVLSPFESAAQVATRPVVNAWRAVSQYDELRDEVARLQEQIDAQRGAEIAARNAVLENQQLRALNELESLANIPTVTATVIGESPSNVDQVIEIDRGSRHDVQVGMAVVNEAGLVGRVTRVYFESSEVLLITDSQYHVAAKVLSDLSQEEVATPDTVPSGVPVDEVEGLLDDPDSPGVGDDPDGPGAGVDDTSNDDTANGDTANGDTANDDSANGDTANDDTANDENPDNGDPENGDPAGDTPGGVGAPTTTAPPVVVQRETGAVNGQGAGRLPQLRFITSTPTLGRIAVGDTVFTSGGRESNAPPDIPIGTVANVAFRPGGTILEIEPAADLNRLQFVRVVLYLAPVEVGR